MDSTKKCITCKHNVNKHKKTSKVYICSYKKAMGIKSHVEYLLDIPNECIYYETEVKRYV
jgi:hypothetical protein